MKYRSVMLMGKTTLLLRRHEPASPVLWFIVQG